MQTSSGAGEPRFPVTFGDVGRVILVTLGFGVLFIIALVLMTTAGIAFPFDEHGQTFAFVAVILQAAYIVGCIYFVVMRRRGLDWRGIGLRPASRRWMLAAVLIGILGVPVVSALTYGLLSLLGQPIKNPQVDLLAPEGYTLFGFFSMLLAAGIVQPFAEELAFRGVLYKLLRKYWAVFPAALVSALLFGALHYFPQVIAGTTLLGFIMALVYERSGSLWVPVILHATYNSASLLVLFALLAAGIDVGAGVEAVLFGARLLLGS
ncbi:MAG: type II CAAX endopeptidase family protein [Alphaproteobacteria bacterium]|nr:type II CAAX endopeptidase family protein [Alphaproteobacteria bacterium]